jgi:hypothetical protein
VTCDSCGFARDSAGKRTSWGSPHDPWFGLPLWLQAPCCGELLWAFNERHLDLLERFVAATVREKPAIMPGRAGSIISKLPAWVKDAHNREAVLRAIAQLRDRAG